MKNAMLSPRFIFVTSAVVLTVVSRIITVSAASLYPDLGNFTMLGAMALFAGACMPQRWMGLVIPLAAMFITDIFIGFHNTMWAVYLSFGLIALLGWGIRSKQTLLSIAGMSLVSALIFFFITNSAMWVVGFFIPASERFYGTGAADLLAALEAGIPFFSYGTLPSQFIFGAIFFGAYHLARVRKPSLIRI